MAVPRNRLSNSRTNKRRSHHAKSPAAAQECKNCGKAFRPHRACLHCGHYKGKSITGQTQEENA
ncbi:MAG: 50S ribosomal protein L32 [Rhabdochlamydiaceae bacterium]|nr:50S ribosomal protein L32 [Candidatus Amphrikana amoebophyrae]